MAWLILNVIENPILTIITPISFDHMEHLGNSLTKIATEKAGIIKNNTPVVIGEDQDEVKDVFLQKASEMNADIHFSSDIKHNYTTDLLGSYQEKNIRTALQTLQVLSGFAISETHIRQGLLNVVKNTNFKGRWQILQEQPKVICDTGHNKEGLTYVLNQLQKEEFNKLHFIFGVVNDKELKDILPLFPKEAVYYFCKPDIPRGLEAKILQQQSIQFGLKGKSMYE